MGRVTISLPDAVLGRVDECAQNANISRSEWIANACAAALLPKDAVIDPMEAQRLEAEIRLQENLLKTKDAEITRLTEIATFSEAMKALLAETNSALKGVQKGQEFVIDTLRGAQFTSPLRLAEISDTDETPIVMHELLEKPRPPGIFARLFGRRE